MSRFDGHFRDLGVVSPSNILALVDKMGDIPHLWANGRRQGGEDYLGNEHIVFRFPDGYPGSHLRASYTELWADWRYLLSPIIDESVSYYGFARFETCKVMLSRLMPGARIPLHVDTNPSSAIPHKIHIPLVTNPSVVFFVEDVPYRLPVGRAYELNNLLPHSVENNSPSARVHLVFDVYPTES